MGICFIWHSRRHGGRGRVSGIFGYGRGRGYIPKLVSKVITLMNGKKIDYHAYIDFSDDIYTIKWQTTIKKLSINKEKNTETSKTITMKEETRDP